MFQFGITPEWQRNVTAETDEDSDCEIVGEEKYDVDESIDLPPSNPSSSNMQLTLLTSAAKFHSESDYASDNVIIDSSDAVQECSGLNQPLDSLVSKYI